MTILKKADREEVARRVLAEAFSPRFSALEAQVRVFTLAKVESEHPEFITLVKNPTARPYIAVTHVSGIYFLGDTGPCIMAAPVYGRLVGMPNTRYLRSDRERDYVKFKDLETLTPYTFGALEISEPEITAPYVTAWADYSAACTSLCALLQGYSVREKFTADFPEFAKYLPAPTAKINLPTVDIGGSRAHLIKLGLLAL